MNKKELIWSRMDELIMSDNVSDSERKIFVEAKQKISKGQDSEAVAGKLKIQLSLLSLKKQLSPDVVPFFTELSRVYLGYGRRDNISIIS